LAEYLKQAGYKVSYIHSDIESLDRIEILHKLRTGEFDILVGVNLLREGLDLPEVSLIAILDADKEGFLRSERSLIQIIGRAARNLNGRVLLYADTMTDSLRRAIAETNRRRTIQVAYNKKHQITPVTIRKEIKANKLVKSLRPDVIKLLKKRDIHDPADLVTYIDQLRKAMVAAAENMEFEQAAVLRDEILRLEDK
jgi:excinuclease ABC subunit B